MKQPSKPAGWKIHSAVFWSNNKSVYGMRYMCRECGKRTLGMGSAGQMHFSGCSRGAGGEKP